MNNSEKISDLAGLLQSGNPRITRKFLERRWGCASVTVHRVIERSRKSGIPIVFSGERYSLEVGKSIQIPGFWLMPSELAALLGLSHWLDILGSGVLRDRLAPVQARLEEMLQESDLNVKDWKERIRLLPIHHRPTDPNILLSVARAVLSRKRVTLRYTGVKDTTSRGRDVSPQTLVRYRDNWYLDGFDHGSKKLRAFALSRISELDVIEKPVREISRLQLDAHFAGAYGIFAGVARRKAVLIFEGLAAKLAGEEIWHPRQVTRLLPDGKVRFEFPCGNVQELARDVMRFADEVTVLGPEELLQAVECMVHRADQKTRTVADSD